MAQQQRRQHPMYNRNFGTGDGRRTIAKSQISYIIRMAVEQNGPSRPTHGCCSTFLVLHSLTTIIIIIYLSSVHFAKFSSKFLQLNTFPSNFAAIAPSPVLVLCRRVRYSRFLFDKVKQAIKWLYKPTINITYLLEFECVLCVVCVCVWQRAIGQCWNCKRQIVVEWNVNETKI